MKVEAEDGMVGADAEVEAEPKQGLTEAMNKKNTEKNQKAPFSPMPRELHVPMQIRRRDHCCKWRLYGSLY